jgi:hypothetical protein
VRAGSPSRQPVYHPSDEDLSLHPIEQKPFVGDPESLGTPDRGAPGCLQIGCHRKGRCMINRRNHSPNLHPASGSNPTC